MHRRDILENLLCPGRQIFLVRFEARVCRYRELVQQHVDVPDVIEDPLALAGADPRVVRIEDDLISAHHGQRRVHQAGVIAIYFRRVGLVGQRYDRSMRQPLKSLIAKLAKRREHLRVVAILKKDRHPRFEVRRKRAESRKVTMVGMLVRDPDVIDLVEHRRIEPRFRQETPRVVKYFSEQPRVHQDRRVGAFRDDARVSDEVDFHQCSPAAP